MTGAGLNIGAAGGTRGALRYKYRAERPPRKPQAHFPFGSRIYESTTISVIVARQEGELEDRRRKGGGVFSLSHGNFLMCLMIFFSAPCQFRSFLFKR